MNVSLSSLGGKAQRSSLGGSGMRTGTDVGSQMIRWVGRRCYSPQQSGSEDRIGLAVVDLTESAKGLAATQQSGFFFCAPGRPTEVCTSIPVCFQLTAPLVGTCPSCFVELCNQETWLLGAAHRRLSDPPYKGYCVRDQGKPAATTVAELRPLENHPEGVRGYT